MSIKGEKYKSKSAEMKHERSEGKRERKMEYGKASAAKMKKVMGEYKRGTLHAGRDPKGPKKAPIVKSRKQAVAIGLSKARKGR